MLITIIRPSYESQGKQLRGKSHREGRWCGKNGGGRDLVGKDLRGKGLGGKYWGRKDRVGIETEGKDR